MSENLIDLENYRRIVSHIQRVHENGLKLAEELIKGGRSRFARRITIEVFKHDLSKFGEFEYTKFFSGDKEELKQAVAHHRWTNPHHIQYYEEYKDIPEVQLACMACDFKARSEEFGDNVKKYLKEFCEEKKISVNTNFYKKLTGFLNLIIEDKFQ